MRARPERAAHRTTRGPGGRRRLGALVPALALVAAGLPVASAAAAPSPDRTPDPSERSLIAEAEESGPQRVIVELRDGGDADALRTMRAGDAEATVEHRYDRFPLATVTADAEALRSLATSPDVAKVYPNRVRSHALAETVPLVGADRVHDRGTDGSGQTVVVVDDGIDARHEFVAGRVVAEACFSGGAGVTLCPNGEREQVGEGAADALTAACRQAAGGCSHGTHVAGIALGAAGGSSPGTGVAPGADLASVQVFSRVDSVERCTAADAEAPCLLADDGDIINGVEHALDLAEDRDVAAVNLSLGSVTHTEHCETPYRIPFQRLVDAGIAPVVASGNSGAPAAVSEPACEPAAVAVGATDDGDTPAGFGNRGTLLDVFAPGVDVTSSVASTSHDGYEAFDGTSMAAPHVAGGFALLRDGGLDGSVDELVGRLRETGTAVTYTSGGEEVTTPRIDLAAAVPTPRAATELEYTGPTEADYHDRFTASARLTSGGEPVSGGPVTFTLGSGGGSQECTATTDGSGQAQCALTPDQRPGETRITADFPGGARLLPSHAEAGFTVTKQETAAGYTGPGKVANGTDVRLSGVLHEEELDGAPVAGRDVTLALGAGDDRQACTGTTDGSGSVTCTVAGLDQPLNDDATVPVTVAFAGDAFYEASRAQDAVLLEHYTGRATGLSAQVDLPLLPSIGVPPTPDTGQVRTADATRTDTACTADVRALVLRARALCPEVTTTLAPGTSTATSTVEHVRIGLPGAPVIEVEGATARSVSTCEGDGSASGATDLTLRVGGREVPVSLRPNTGVDLPGGTLRLVVNEQVPDPDAEHGLVVNAVHLTSLDGLVDVTVASAASGVHHCAS